MSRRLALTTTALLVAALAAAPAHAAGAKVIKGSYTVTLTPDPTLEADGQLGDGCDGAANPSAVDNHPFTVPGAGTLDVVLDSPDPTGAGVTDWDLWILDSDRSVNTGSHGATSHEEAVVKYKAAQKIIIQACNLAGQPSGTVSYTFTPKKK